jgi:hypothetical protein
MNHKRKFYLVLVALLVNVVLLSGVTPALAATSPVFLSILRLRQRGGST